MFKRHQSLRERIHDLFSLSDSSGDVVRVDGRDCVTRFNELEDLQEKDELHNLLQAFEDEKETQNKCFSHVLLSL